MPKLDAPQTGKAHTVLYRHHRPEKLKARWTISVYTALKQRHPTRKPNAPQTVKTHAVLNPNHRNGNLKMYQTIKPMRR